MIQQINHNLIFLLKTKLSDEVLMEILLRLPNDPYRAREVLVKLCDEMSIEWRRE